MKRDRGEARVREARWPQGARGASLPGGRRLDNGSHRPEARDWPPGSTPKPLTLSDHRLQANGGHGVVRVSGLRRSSRDTDTDTSPGPRAPLSAAGRPAAALGTD